MRIAKEVLNAIKAGTNYIVLRPSEDLKGKVSKHYDGYWYDRASIPLAYNPNIHEWARANPSGDYEVRDDGAVAEVWIVELNKEFRQEGKYPGTFAESGGLDE